MARSLRKGPFSFPFGFSSSQPSASSSKLLQVWSRNSCILPQFVGLLVHVHTGKAFLPLRISEHMIGHTFGEFASTRKKGAHKKKGKK